MVAVVKVKWRNSLSLVHNGCPLRAISFIFKVSLSSFPSSSWIAFGCLIMHTRTCTLAHSHNFFTLSSATATFLLFLKCIKHALSLDICSCIFFSCSALSQDSWRLNCTSSGSVLWHQLFQVFLWSPHLGKQLESLSPPSALLFPHSTYLLFYLIIYIWVLILSPLLEFKFHQHRFFAQYFILCS